jgi:hypothetical protein
MKELFLSLLRKLLSIPEERKVKGCELLWGVGLGSRYGGTPVLGLIIGFLSLATSNLQFPVDMVSQTYNPWDFHYIIT